MALGGQQRQSYTYRQMLGGWTDCHVDDEAWHLLTGRDRRLWGRAMVQAITTFYRLSAGNY